MNVTCRLACTATAVALVTVAIDGQSSTETVPKEVMAALLRGPGVSLSEGFAMRVGSAPSMFPLELLPPGSTVAASGVSDRATVVLAIASDITEANRFKEHSRLQALGWSNSMPGARGFVPTINTPPPSFCRGADTAMVATLPRPEGGSFVRVSLTRDSSRPCTPRIGLQQELFVPPLYPPEGLKYRGGGSGGGGNDAVYSSTRLEGTQSPRRVATHYANLLKQYGWSVDDDDMESRELAIVRLSAKIESGAELTGILTVTSLGAPNGLDVHMRVIRHVISTPPSLNPSVTFTRP